jgi:hypothetical protein
LASSPRVLGQQQRGPPRVPRGHVEAQAALQREPVLAALDVQQVDVEGVLPLGRGGVGDLRAVAREAAELPEAARRGQQLPLPGAVRGDQVEALPLVARAVRGVEDPVAGRRPGVEVDAVAPEGDLARPAAGRVDHPGLGLAGDVGPEGEPRAVGRERRSGGLADVEEAQDVRPGLPGEARSPPAPASGRRLRSASAAPAAARQVASPPPQPSAPSVRRPPRPPPRAPIVNPNVPQIIVIVIASAIPAVVRRIVVLLRRRTTLPRPTDLPER